MNVITSKKMKRNKGDYRMYELKDLIAVLKSGNEGKCNNEINM